MLFEMIGKDEKMFCQYWILAFKVKNNKDPSFYMRNISIT